MARLSTVSYSSRFRDCLSIISFEFCYRGQESIDLEVLLQVIRCLLLMHALVGHWLRVHVVTPDHAVPISVLQNL